MHKMGKLEDYMLEVAEQFPNPIVNDAGVNREMDSAEKAAWYKFSAERRIEKENQDKLEANLQAEKQALLDRLGITEAEAKLLLS